MVNSREIQIQGAGSCRSALIMMPSSSNSVFNGVNRNRLSTGSESFSRSSSSSRSSTSNSTLTQDSNSREQPVHRNRNSRSRSISRIVLPGPDGMIKIPIIGYEVMEERARFTVFKLKVENDCTKESWLVFRRYTDFERLCSKLKEEFPKLNINLPPKRWLRDNFDSIFLEDRMKGLQAFVDSILVQHKLGDSPIIREFFCLDEPPSEGARLLFGTSVEETLFQLREELANKESENTLLKAELALLRAQHENQLKLSNAKLCRGCNRRLSLPGLLLSSTPKSSGSLGSGNSSRASLPFTPKKDSGVQLVVDSNANHTPNINEESSKN